MRFCMVCTFYPPYSFGGDAISVRHLAHALVRLGHDVTVVHDADAYATLKRDSLPTLREEERDDGVRVIRLKSRWSMPASLLVHQLGRPVLHATKLRHLLGGNQFDVVVFHNPSLIGGPAILTWPREAVTIYMAREHWLICPTHVLWRHRRERCEGRQCLRCVASYRRPPQLWRYTGAVERALEQVDLVFALSDFSRQMHREFGLSRDMEVLPNFIPDEELRASAVRSPRPQERPYFLFAGRLERIKGLDDVVPVFRRLPEVDLLIAGSGEEEGHLRRLASGLANVRFLGRLSQLELYRYYRHAEAGLVTSVGYEAFPRVLIETLSAGVPVVARDIGPSREVVERSGAGVLFSTAEELHAALAALLRDPRQRATLAARAIPAVRANWSESVVVPRFVEHVRTAAARRATPPRAGGSGVVGVT